jgi:hypothetical protein
MFISQSAPFCRNLVTPEGQLECEPYWYTRLGDHRKSKNRSRPRSEGGGDSTLLRIGGKAEPWVFPSPAENDNVEAQESTT